MPIVEKYKIMWSNVSGTTEKGSFANLANDLDELVFNNRNKDYGAYIARKQYPKYAIIAFGVSAVFLLLFAALIILIVSYWYRHKQTKLDNCG